MDKYIVLLRHGQSTWNLENRFTGWTDVPLTPQGEQEAHQAALLLKEQGFRFDHAFTSYLCRAVHTLELVLNGLGQTNIPVEKSWRLNEKHYGALQGLNKQETAQKYGEEQVLLWRRAYDAPPPALAVNDPRSPLLDPLYTAVPRQDLPLTESLKDTAARLLPYWQETIFPHLQQETNLLVVAHGNSLRAVVRHLKQLSEADTLGLNLPTGVPYVLQFNKDLQLIKDYFLGNPEQIRRAAEAVAKQAKTS